MQIGKRRTYAGKSNFERGSVKAKHGSALVSIRHCSLAKKASKGRREGGLEGGIQGGRGGRGAVPSRDCGVRWALRLCTDTMGDPNRWITVDLDGLLSENQNSHIISFAKMLCVCCYNA